MILMWANPLLGPLKGKALKISTFLGLNSTRVSRCHFRAQKSLDFQCPPLPMPFEMDTWPHQNHYVPRHISKRYINSYFNASKWRSLFLNLNSLAFSHPCAIHKWEWDGKEERDQRSGSGRRSLGCALLDIEVNEEVYFFGLPHRVIYFIIVLPMATPTHNGDNVRHRN